MAAARRLVTDGAWVAISDLGLAAAAAEQIITLLKFNNVRDGLIVYTRDEEPRQELVD